MSRLLPPFASPIIRGVGDLIAPRGKGDGRLCILNYHRILASPDPLLDGEPNVETFEWQMRLLSECFNVLQLHDAVQLLGTDRMPPRAVAITFDDGYRSIHDLALPVLARYQLPATVFVTTGHMSEKGSMWNDMILEAVRRLPDSWLDLRDIGLERYSMENAEERKHTARILIEQCKYMSLPARAKFTDHLQTLAGTPLRQDLMLDNDMLRALAANHIEIGGHTVSHPILTQLDDDAAMREIVDNKLQLEDIIGRPVRLFAYPNGKYGQDYDARHVQMVTNAGYSAAFTTSPGAATRQDARYELPRSRPWDDTPLMFAARLLHWLHGKV